jgi:hypothetical protein
MRRFGIHSALVVGSVFLLAGCSLLPQIPNSSSRDDDDEEETSEEVELSARDLEDLFDPDDAPGAFRLDMVYETIDGPDWAEEVETYWSDSEGSEQDCLDSYSASYLVGADHSDDEHVKIAVNDSESDYSYVSVDGRVFADADSAADYFDLVEEAAADCDDAGGYSLYSEDGEEIWIVTGASTDEADDLDLPDGVRGLIQEEQVEPDFAESYRVILLQRGNVVVAVTVQPAGDGEFDQDDGDKLAELVAESLGDLD